MKQKIIPTGIIGFGLSGKVFHAPFLHTHPGFEIKKVVERHHEESKTIYPYVDVVKDYKDLLQDPSIELIIVCTPNTYHYSMTKESLLAGKHVVIEKPFTPTSKEADELIEIAASKNLSLFIYHNRRWDGDFITIQKVLKSGVLGNKAEYEAHFDRYKPDVRSEAWRELTKPGSGILYDLGSHLIDQALVLFGIPKTLKADIQKQRNNSQVDDFFKVVLNYNGFRAILSAGMMVDDPGPRYVIHGVLGSFVKFGIDPQEKELQKGMMPVGENWGAESPDKWGMITIDYQDLNIDGNVETEHGDYMGFYDNVYNVMTKGESIAIKPTEARNVIKIIELAFDSDKNKKEVQVVL